MASPDTESLVSCRELSIGYQAANGVAKAVVSSASFEVRMGEAIGFVGESGSGKSTLARALLGYRRSGGVFMGGTLHFRDTELTNASTQAIARLRGISIAMVPQNPLASLTFHRTVGQQMLEVLITRAALSWQAAHSRMLELLSRTGIQQPDVIAARYPHQLSGGQRQRVVIAAALACDPALIVLDEPTTALDRSTAAQVLDLVKEVREKSGAALVLVTHDLHAVSKVCDRVLVMKDGRIVEEGTVSQVFRTPQTAYARELIAASLQIDADNVPQPAAPAPRLLRMSKLNFSYGSQARWLRKTIGRPVLQDVTLELAKGEILGVIGESGSGKTTLGSILCGMLALQAGEIEFDGRPLPGRLASRSKEQLRRIQMIFQDPLSSLNPRKTVADAVLRPLKIYKRVSEREGRAQAARLLDELGMGQEYLDRFPRSLSGGQQQRVAIARAFAAEPDLLICDEITSALDASIQGQVLEQLLEMQRRRQAAMLLITHDLSVIWKLAPRVIVMKDGVVVEQGETAQVFLQPRHPYTAMLVASTTN